MRTRVNETIATHSHHVRMNAGARVNTINTDICKSLCIIIVRVMFTIDHTRAATISEFSRD